MIVSKAVLVLLRIKKVATVVVQVIEGILKLKPSDPVKPLGPDDSQHRP